MKPSISRLLAMAAAILAATAILASAPTPAPAQPAAAPAPTGAPTGAPIGAAAPSNATAPPFLLFMPDLSSPRATIAALRTNAELARRDLLAHGPTWVPRPSVLRMLSTLDLSSYPLPPRTLAAVTAAAELAFVLDNLPPGRLAGAPDLAEVERENIGQWRVPDTPIVLVRIASGPRMGDFLFSTTTQAISGQLYRATKQEIAHGASILTPVDQWSYSPGPLIPRGLVQALPKPLLTPVLGQAVWQWIGLVVLCVAAVTAILRVGLWGIRYDATQTHAFRRYGQLVAPGAICGICILTLVLAFFGLKIWGDTLADLVTTLKLILFVALTWLAIALIRRIEFAILESLGVRSTGIDGQLIRVVGTLLSIAVILSAIFFIGDFIGIPLGPLLAGLGIGGLAVALAVRPTLENVIGGLTLFADRPVHVGDYCDIGGESGWVEEIGLRTTKVRRLDDILLTIPNSEMAQIRIANRARRRKALFNPIIGLRYETTGAQLKRIASDILAMLARHPRVLDDGARVHLAGFGDYTLNLEIFAYLDAIRRPEIAAIEAELNFVIMDIVAASGTAFAFPSQTNYLARDTIPTGETPESA